MREDRLAKHGSGSGKGAKDEMMNGSKTSERVEIFTK